MKSSDLQSVGEVFDTIDSGVANERLKQGWILLKEPLSSRVGDDIVVRYVLGRLR